jgi:hypothetical protein
MRVPAVLITVLFSLSACGPRTYVKADDAALGRVVVYRNGVAFYERRASLDGDTLTLRVPADRVDDFLKSLTVADARTGQPLPVAFPSPGMSDGTGEVTMTVRLPPGPGRREVVLTYVTEAPAWKPSYRVVIDDAGRVTLEGWAIVDNTSGEDWHAVRVGVGSSSALAFRYDLHSVRLVHRDILKTQDRFVVAPPMGGSTYRTDGPGEQLVEEIADADLPREHVAAATVPADALAQLSKRHSRGNKGKVSAGEVATRSAAPPAAMHGDGAGTLGSVPAPSVDTRRQLAQQDRIRAMAESLRRRGETVVIEGFADATDADPRASSLQRAHTLRNQLIKEGVPPAQLQVASRGVVPGQKAGVRLVAQPQQQQSVSNAPGKDAVATKDDGEPVGESHFESTTPMSVGRGTSAMVAILKDKAPGEIVYLYDSESERGDKRYAFRAVLFKNPTGSTLETGPVTVYGRARFVGEGLTEAIPPHATAVVPFALDRQVVVERQGDEGDRIAKLITLQRGILTCEMQHRKTTKLRITNRLQEPTTMLVRHTTPRGWTISAAPSESEQYGTARLYRVKLAAGETKTIQIDESTPMQKTLDLRSPDGLTMVRTFLESSDRTPAFGAQTAKLVKLQREIADTEEAIESLRQRGDEYRLRMDELHGQIVSLGVTKTGGPLTAHLQAKMKEISEKVQRNTLDVVTAQEKLMLARVGFQDTLAELTLEPATSSVARN